MSGRTLVTGGSGYLGEVSVRHLRERGDRVRVLEAIRAAGLEGATDADLERATGEPAQKLKSVLTRLAASRDAWRLVGLWFAETALETLRARVRAHLGEHASLGVAAFKELAGVSRKQAIPLLEQLDREGTTRRQGDLRVLGGRR